MTEELLYSKIEQTLSALDISKITDDRKGILNPLVAYIREKTSKQEAIALTFICTHNSRRSHLAQIWAQTIAFHIGLQHISCYSGGTEATALFPMVAETLRQSGFEIERLSEGDNPIYGIKYTANTHPIIGFSKTFDHAFNPIENFAAIMTCSSADEECPFVGGSDGRFPIPFEDPKVFDQSPLQQKTYQERNLQIATELLYVMKKAIRIS